MPTCGFRLQGSGFRVQGSGFRVQGAGIRVLSAGFRVQGAGFRVAHAFERENPRAALLLRLGVQEDALRRRHQAQAEGPRVAGRRSAVALEGRGERNIKRERKRERERERETDE